MGTVKIAILEIDGVELDVPTEMNLMDALNHIGYSGGSGGFSKKRIPIDTSVTVPENQEMIVTMNMTIDGELIINGEMEII